jgi:hypothetical protein
VERIRADARLHDVVDVKEARVFADVTEVGGDDGQPATLEVGEVVLVRGVLDGVGRVEEVRHRARLAQELLSST